MKGLITLFAFLLFISGELYSQAADYVFSSSTGTYSEITGTPSSAAGDNGVETLTLPFPFKYCGTTYLGWEGSNVLASTTVKPIIAGLWDELYDDEFSDIRYTTNGSSPNRIFVVQWKNIRWRGANGAQENFQVRLTAWSGSVSVNLHPARFCQYDYLCEVQPVRISSRLHWKYL